MTPDKYLNTLGNKYFKELEKILQDRGMDKEEFSYNLSILAKMYATFHECVQEENEKGRYVTAKTGWQQEATWVQRQDKCIISINTLSAKFGMSPLDFQKVKGEIKEKVVKSPLEKMM